MMTDSQQLLADFKANGSEKAFQELVSRYLDLVYSTALRLVDGDTHRAKDVAQTVFVDLARRAGKLTPNTMLGGWLHRHTCFVARTLMRGERRRQAREKQAAALHALDTHPDPAQADLALLLDETIQELGPDDRDAILLRFFERRNLRSVGEVLGISENVAQKRVARAVQELGALLRQRGLTLSAVALAGSLTAETIKAAPAGLGISVAKAALAHTGATAGIAAPAAKVALTKVGVVSLLLVAGLATTLFLHHPAEATRPAETQLSPPPLADAQPADPPNAPSAAQPDSPPLANQTPLPVPKTEPPPAFNPKPEAVSLPAGPIATSPPSFAVDYQRLTKESHPTVSKIPYSPHTAAVLPLYCSPAHYRGGPLPVYLRPVWSER